jgi:undecaprenyl-diphosphatase
VFLTFQAFVLGLVQGATEFIPVSSSGHLQAIPFLFGWEAGTLEFDVAIHLGTLLAVLVVFRTDLLDMLRAVLPAALRSGVASGPDVPATRASRRLVVLLAVASVPAALFGLLARDLVGAAFEAPLAVAAFLCVTAVLLWWSERRRTSLGTVEPDPATAAEATAEELSSLTWRSALGVGAAQALAILPGISRSGATIAAGMALGLSRGAAARFSFLMLIPVTIGAAAVTLPGLGTVQEGSLPFGTTQVLVGILTSAVSGYLAIRFLLALVARRSLVVFARYVLVLAAVIVVAAAVRG